MMAVRKLVAGRRLLVTIVSCVLSNNVIMLRCWHRTRELTRCLFRSKAYCPISICPQLDLQIAAVAFDFRMLIMARLADDVTITEVTSDILHVLSIQC